MSDLVSDTTTKDELGNETRVRVYANGTRITTVQLGGFQMIQPPVRRRQPDMANVSSRQLDLMLEDATADEQEELISRWDEIWASRP